MKILTEFLTRCRQQLKNNSNLFWVSLQSNSLADLCPVEDDFDAAVQKMKEDMKRNGWILPTLRANMRNQVNIAKVQVKQGATLKYSIQYSIEKLPSGSSLIGEIPISFRVRSSDWDKKKYEVLRHCIELISQKNEKNIVFLWDCSSSNYSRFIKLKDDIKSVVKDKKVVCYPSKYVNVGISNVTQFVEKRDHILVTRNTYFNGCECANVIFLTDGFKGVRNSILRGVQNILCIHVTDVRYEARFNGMKKDDRFYEKERRT